MYLTMFSVSMRGGRGHGTPVDDMLPARCCERVQFLGRVRGKWHLPLVVGGRLLKERGVDENAVVKVEVVLVVGGTGWGRDGTQSGGSRMEEDKVLARVGVGLMTGDHRRLVPERRRVGTHELDNVPFPRRVQDELTVLPDQPPESVIPLLHALGRQKSPFQHVLRRFLDMVGRPELTRHHGAVGFVLEKGGSVNGAARSPQASL